jgi:hypothetical protein
MTSIDPDRHARPRYGPARESPSWLQRRLIAAPPLLMSILVGHAFALFPLAVLVIMGSPRALLVAGLWCFFPVGVAGSVFIARVREDRGLSVEERLDRWVPYTPSPVEPARGFARRHPALALVAVVVGAVSVVRTCWRIVVAGFTVGAGVWAGHLRGRRDRARPGPAPRAFGAVSTRDFGWTAERKRRWLRRLFVAAEHSPWIAVVG